MKVKEKIENMKQWYKENEIEVKTCAIGTVIVGAISVLYYKAGYAAGFNNCHRQANMSEIKFLQGLRAKDVDTFGKVIDHMESNYRVELLDKLTD